MHLGEFLPPLLASLPYGALYALRVRGLPVSRRPARWRIVCFAAGLTLLVIVQLPPLDGLADSVLIAHAVQHILIGDVCSLLIVLGLTGPVLQPWLALPIGRPMRVLSHPLVALTLWAADLYAWHLPLLYQLAVRHDLIHAGEHACLLWFGVLLWLALLGPLPKPRWFGNWARLGYMVAVRLAGAVLANVLIWTQGVIYPVYRASDARHGLNPVSDQNVAGGVMMIEQMLITVALLGWLFYRASIEDEQRQRLLDLAADRGIALSEERAGRAAAAGATERLRERLLEDSAPERG